MRTRSTWQTGAAAAGWRWPRCCWRRRAGLRRASPNPTTSTFTGAATPSGTWAYPNGDLANTRVAADTTITSANVSSLREAWSFHLAGTAAAGVHGVGSFAATPVVVDGVVYLQDLDANVYAISLATGKLRWEYPVNVPEATGPGPDGVAVADGVVYGDTSTAVFALNAATGKVIWTDDGLLTSGQGSFEIQPQVSGGRVYLASAYGSGPGGGVLLALNASSGKLLWKFNTVTGGQAAGVATLGLGSGGAWETPLVGSDGSVTFGIGNPYQSIGEAINAPGAAALHRQRGEPGRGDREAALVLPGGAERLQGLRHAGLADRGRGRQGSGDHRQREAGHRLRDERLHRRAAVEDAGRRAQRDR